MRRDPTNAEKLFWWEVKDRRLDGHKFRRQHPIGPYITDFACIKGKIVVEIDGGQHVEAMTYDKQRDLTCKREASASSVFGTPTF